MKKIDELTESLPSELQERTRRINRKCVGTSGEFILYWMRAAIRDDENPALNVAIHVANQLSLPLLVYQGLSERYPYASDRHHQFILQGARDVQAAMRERDISYALHVERAGNRGPHLKSLGMRAAVLVTEDVPTDPLRRWTTRLSTVIGCSLLAVDTACVVPMRLIGKSFDRAFAFRNATKKLYAERVAACPVDVPLRTDCRQIDLPFTPVDLANDDIEDLVSQCDIDHSVGPVPHTPGGSVAGYRRWDEFKTRRLSSYDRSRNNALVDGVSRMSPYLHHGMVAPTRIAREAVSAESDGADKFLDELLIWRELAHAFCYFRQDHGRISAIPQWARDVLAKHEQDARTLLSWETMARGRTGDSIWDSAQRSLLIHGELHNNVRMTWGKAVLSWTSNAQRALARLIDLNHRYALDGRDPASYGGILWCLGQFDRPFSPEQPVLGSVRSRSTRQHAKRLDPATYRRRVNRSLWDRTPRVAVVGAGIAGLMCARTLSDHGCEVTIYEKSRGVGGRMSTRRGEGSVCFDHGTQYFTARDDRFKRYVQSWIDDGIVQPWNGRIVVVDRGDVQSETAKVNRYVAVPAMSSLAKHMASDLNVQLETVVAEPQRVGDKWSVRNVDGDELGQFDILVVAVPSQQAAALLTAVPDLATRSRDIAMKGCWALMLAFEDSLGIDFDGAFVNQSPLAWIARNSSKPKREAGRETWVLHATPEWTESHLDAPSEQVEQQLFAEFCVAVGKQDVVPVHSDTQRWRYAVPEFATRTQSGRENSLGRGSLGSPSKSINTSCLFNDQQWVGACGDWCAGARVEGAFLSGMALAGRILGRLNSTTFQTSKQKHQLNLF